MAYSDLFPWWASTISAGTLFLVIVSVYLYLDSLKRLKDREKKPYIKIAWSFTFVWALIGLLALYLVSINRGSSLLFAVGNIVFESILIIYVVKNRTKPE
jgi:amino acid transporter